ncbi:hypothetical protein ACYZT3_25540 [Pseudomonas sp. MDT1-16]
MNNKNVIPTLLLIMSSSISAAEPIASQGVIRFHGSIANTPCELSTEKLHQIVSKNSQRELTSPDLRTDSKCISADNQKSVNYRIQSFTDNNTLKAKASDKKTYLDKTIILSYN